MHKYISNVCIPKEILSNGKALGGDTATIDVWFKNISLGIKKIVLKKEI